VADQTASETPTGNRRIADIIGMGDAPDPVAVQLHATELTAVLIGRSGDSVTAYRSDTGRVEVLSGEMTAEPVTDASLRAAALTQALKATQQHARDAEAQLRRQHQAQLDEIRDEAVSKYNEGGEICRPGLDDFLARHGMEPYNVRREVEFTIRGRLVIDSSSDEYTVESDVRENLCPDTAAIDDIEDDSVDYTVTASSRIA